MYSINMQQRNLDTKSKNTRVTSMYKVLVIEDDVMMSSMLAMYLVEEGYEVRQALLVKRV